MVPEKWKGLNCENSIDQKEMELGLGLVVPITDDKNDHKEQVLVGKLHLDTFLSAQ